MTITCRVLRGLAREVEEDVNKLLAIAGTQLVHVAQSESGDHITVTLFLELPERNEGEDG